MTALPTARAASPSDLSPSGSSQSGIANAREPDEYLKSLTYKPEIPFFTKALNGEEIVEALETRIKGLATSEFFIAVHWSVLREARDEIETLRWELAKSKEINP